MCKGVKPDNTQIEMLHTLKKSGYTIFCVSNCIRNTIELCLQGLHIIQFFSGIISNEDTREPKPSPLPYLTAFDKYNVLPDECLILEDSPYGIMSAKLSGAHVLCIDNIRDVNIDNILRLIDSYT